VRYPVSKTGGLRPWGFDSLSFRLEALPTWKGSALLTRRWLAAMQVRILLPPLSLRCGRAVRRATVNREAQVRSLPPEPSHAPVVEQEMTPDSQSGSCGFESRRGYRLTSSSARKPTPASRHRHVDRLLPVGELGTPPALGAGDRWFDSSRADSRRRGEAVLASLMSSRPWVRIPPALSRGRSSAA
jgi:hypothetical protein